MSFIKSRKTTPSIIATTTTNSISISNCGGSRDAMVEDEEAIDEEEVLIAHQREMLADDEDEEEEDGGGICSADYDEDFHPSCHTPPKLGSNYSQDDPILDNKEQQVNANYGSHIGIGPVEEDISIKDFQEFEDIGDMFNRPLPPSILAKIEPFTPPNGSATSSSLPIAPAANVIEEEFGGDRVGISNEDEDFYPSYHTPQPPTLGSNREDFFLDTQPTLQIGNNNNIEQNMSMEEKGGGRSILDGEDDFDKATPTSSETSQKKKKMKLWGEPPIPFIRVSRKPISQANTVTTSVSANNDGKEQYVGDGGPGVCSEDEDFRPSCHTPTLGRSSSRDDADLMVFDEQQQVQNKNHNEEPLDNADNGIGHPQEEEEDISGTMGFEDPDLKEIAELYNRAVSPSDLATISLSPPPSQPVADDEVGSSSKEEESAEDNKQDESEKKEEDEATSEDKEEEEKQPAKVENISLGFQMFKNFDELLTCPANISPLPPPEPIVEEDGSSSEEGEEPEEDDKQVEDEEKTEEEKKKKGEEEEATPEEEKEVEEDFSIKDFDQDVQVRDIADWLSGVLPTQVLAKIGPPASQQQSSSLPAAEEDRPRVIYTREQIRAVGQSRSADEWTTYMWTNHGDTWPIHNQPFELDPALRCPYALQLRVERERERDGRMHYATKFGVQRAQQETVMAVVGNQQQRRSSQPGTPTKSKMGGKQPQQNDEDGKPKKAKKNKKKSSKKNEDKEEAGKDDSKKKKDTKTIGIGTQKPGPAMAKVLLMMSTSAQAPAKNWQEEEKPSSSFSKKANPEKMKKLKDRNMANILAEQKEEAKKREQKDAEEMDWTNSELEDDDEDEEEEQEEQKQRKKKENKLVEEEEQKNDEEEKKGELEQKKKSKMATMVEKAVRNMVDVVMVAVPDEEGGKRELVSLDSLVECQLQIANQWKQNPMAQQIWNGYLAQIVKGIEQLKLSSSDNDGGGSATTNE